MNALNIVVLAKQVPDTRQVGKDAMTAEGTVNRAALPAIFNPEDLHALEMALSLKERIPGSLVHLLTMGPQRAADIIREAMFRGADGGYLLSGRQAIDGDTAQVGPQVAEKLSLPQVTYAEEVIAIGDESLTIRRRIDAGLEVVECPLPAVITVNGSAPACRPRHAKRLMHFKSARTASELAVEPTSLAAQRVAEKPELQIIEWSAADIDPDQTQLGLQGSPTKVKRIENVVFQAKEAKRLEATDEALEGLIQELIAAHTIG